jgi:hypothetical protein
LLRTDRLNVMPMNNAVVARWSPAWARRTFGYVLIAGKVIEAQRPIVGVDFERLTRLGDQARDRLYAMPT